MDKEQRLLELLEKIEASNRKQCRYVKLQFILTVIAAVSCVAFFVVLSTLLPQIQGIVTQAQTVLSNLESVTSTLVKADLIGMVENINSLVGNVDGLINVSEASIMEAMDNINNIDFEGLNAAIDDLSSVIDPIAKFFKNFRF